MRIINEKINKLKSLTEIQQYILLHRLYCQDKLDDEKLINKLKELDLKYGHFRGNKENCLRSFRER
jgi:hypothetical protein